MPRLDAERVAVFRALGMATTAIARRLDADLMANFDLPLAWFDVMSALQRHRGSLRVNELRDALDEVPSSLSRRLDRMEQEGWIVRGSGRSVEDRRAVTVSLTRRGRELWRDANVHYRRGVQQLFAKDLSATDLAALQRVLGKITAE